jgi:cation transport regulator ChaB
MRDQTTNTWEARRRKAIKRLVEAWEKYGDTEQRDDPDPLSTAADAVAVAHLAKTFDWEGGAQTDWNEKAARMIDQVVEIWEEYERNDEDREVIEELLNVALNAFAIAHVAASFEWGSGPLEW